MAEESGFHRLTCLPKRDANYDTLLRDIRKAHTWASDLTNNTEVLVAIGFGSYRPVASLVLAQGPAVQRVVGDVPSNWEGTIYLFHSADDDLRHGDFVDVALTSVTFQYQLNVEHLFSSAKY